MLPDPTAPVPISAQITTVPTVLTVTFDQPITPGFGLAGNWNARANLGGLDKAFTPVGPVIFDGSTAGFIATGAPAAPNPNVVNYLAVPPNVTGLVGGLPAAAFANFPLTVIP